MSYEGTVQHKIKTSECFLKIISDCVNVRLMATIQNVLFNHLDFHRIRDELFCIFSTESCIVQIFDMIAVGIVKYHVRLFNIYSSSRTVWTLCIYSDAVVSFTVIQPHVTLQLAKSYKNTKKNILYRIFD